jgi:hypothetical protein
MRAEGLKSGDSRSVLAWPDPGHANIPMVTWPPWLRLWATELDRLAGGGGPRVLGDLEAGVPALEAEREQCYAAALEALRAWMDWGLGKEG